MDSEILLWIAGFMFLFLILGKLYLELTCPSCGKFFAKVVEKKEEVGKRYEEVSVERQVKKHDGAEPPNFETRVTDYRLTFTKFINHCRCKYCSHVWEAHSEKRTDKDRLREYTRPY